jgi:hypothetical protein
MSLEYDLVAALTALALLTAVPDSVQAQPLNEKVTIECDAFHKNADGSWSLSRKTDVNDGIYSEFSSRASIERTRSTSSASISSEFSSKTARSHRKPRSRPKGRARPRKQTGAVLAGPSQGP